MTDYFVLTVIVQVAGFSSRADRTELDDCPVLDTRPDLRSAHITLKEQDF